MTDLRPKLRRITHGGVVFIRCRSNSYGGGYMPCTTWYTEQTLYCPDDCGHPSCELEGLDSNGLCKNCRVPPDAECQDCGATGQTIRRVRAGGYFACPRHTDQVRKEQHKVDDAYWRSNNPEHLRIQEV